MLGALGPKDTFFGTNKLMKDQFYLRDLISSALRFRIQNS